VLSPPFNHIHYRPNDLFDKNEKLMLKKESVTVEAKPAGSKTSPVGSPPVTIPATALSTSSQKEASPALSAVETATTLAPETATPLADKLIIMKGPIVVKDIAAALNLKSFQVMHHLMELNVFATLTQVLEEDQAKKLCAKLGYTFQIEKRNKEVHPPAPPPKEKKIIPVATPDNHKSRPPVVTIMGHVDHGKTSLLDAIRQTRVASGEAGGITQHIGAYQVKKNDHLITFIDTPGHAAFTAMRARGASVTDIVILVVAADDGPMPQTIESVNHARAAKVPIIVAINKCDLPSANPMKIKGQLQEPHIGLQAEDYGGDTICVEVSATKGIGLEKLLEMILLQAEILELKAAFDGPVKARVVESQTEVGRGPTATVLIQSGTLKVGDFVLCDKFYGRVKSLVNDLGQSIKEATPGMPVKLIGLNGVPSPGDEVETKKTDKEARDLAEIRGQASRLEKIEAAPQVTLENLFDTIADGQKKTLNIVLRADVQGSVEAIIGQFKKIESKKVDLEVVAAGVGPINESDVVLAKASHAVVIGFNTKTDNAGANAAKREGVQIKLYSIIYELFDQVKEAMAGLLDPELREQIIGTVLVKKVFSLSKYPVAGCSVQNGRVTRNARARVMRRKQPIYDGGIQTLKRFQDDVSEVRSGMECGIRLGDFTEYEEGDIIECYLFEKFPQTL
jgi:translation initiation factor IF-2